jgi:L-alanine-DL-glutamate epimerase-like enolase superfamily enzyme
MRITRLETWSVALRLDEPYTIAYETVDSAVNLFVRLHTDGPHVGHGVAAPDPAVTGETLEDARTALEAAEAVVHGIDPTRPAQAVEQLSGALHDAPAALAALDMAIWDLLGQAAGLPLWRLLGGARERIRTSVTIGILDAQQTVAQARRFLGEGFTSLKLKGGLDPAGDAERACKVREVAGPGVELSLDANQGYTVEQALAFLRDAQRALLAYLEQPTPRNHPEWLGEVQQRTSVPIMADECLLAPEDALHLAANRLVRRFNVKVQKVGGLSAALAIDAIAAAADVGVMVGCTDECTLGIAAGLHFALARPNVRHADLDGHLALIDDPTAGAVMLRDGWLVGSDRPGLGVAVG